MRSMANDGGFVPFVDTERLALEGDTWGWDERKRSIGLSWGIHLFVFLLLVLPLSSWLMWGDSDLLETELRIRFPIAGGKGRGGGGGGGGSGGKRMSAYIPVQVVEPQTPEVTQPREAAIAPRIPTPINADSLRVPDLPEETASLLDSVYSPDAIEMPGLSLTDLRDHGGVDTERSSGEGGGIGGGEGTGVGPGEGWGVGPGRGGGFGGGDYSPGGHDVEPVVVFKPPAPAYPPRAHEKFIEGEVILQIRVLLDGSTQVLGVVKSLPYCVSAAKQNAALWKWKPALKEGKPIETTGIITVNFSRFAR